MKSVPLTICLALGATSAGAFWQSLMHNRSLAERASRVSLVQLRPEIVNGLYVDINEIDPEARPTSISTILIATSDTCAGCARAAGGWHRLIDRLSSTNEKTRLITMSYQGGELADAIVMHARRAGLEARRARPANIYKFQISTGIVSTPQTLILDDGLRVRLVTNSMETEDVDQIVDVISSLRR